MTGAEAAGLSDQEMAELRWAYRHLEHPSFAARLSDVLALPLEEGIGLLPRSWQRRLMKAAEASICQSLKLAIGSLQASPPSATQHLLHRFMASGVGAVGGFFGPLTLMAELPVVTTLILRAIADRARAEGEDLSQVDARMACVQVFALGGRTRDDDAAEVGYYGLRIALGLHFERDILQYATAARGPHIPAGIEMVRGIAARFGVVVSDKAAAQLVPVAGAAGGAMLNLIFMKHYQDMARGHFTIRRLERLHGVETVKAAYQGLQAQEQEREVGFSSVEGW